MSKKAVFFSKLMYSLVVATFGPIMSWVLVLASRLCMHTLGDIPGMIAAALVLGVGLPLLFTGIFRMADEARHDVLKYFYAIESKA
jgi:hypothetical protein